MHELYKNEPPPSTVMNGEISNIDQKQLAVNIHSSAVQLGIYGDWLTFGATLKWHFHEFSEGWWRLACGPYTSSVHLQHTIWNILPHDISS